MQTFKLDEQYMVVCESMNRRGGFKHVATLLKNGGEVDSTKCLYVNRTWESFAYQSVLEKLIHQHFVGSERDEFLAKINKR